LQVALNRVGQGLDDIFIRKYPMQNLRGIFERLASTVFHAMRPEILASEGFGENLQ